MSTRRIIELLTIALSLGLFVLFSAACASDADDSNRRSTFGGVKSETGTRVPEDDGGRCPTEGGLVEESLDTSGDNVADVRKVWRVEGEGAKARKILTCRELDLNHDGTKDIFRFFNEDGRPLREETDVDFDGRIDAVSFFENGRIVRQERDRNHDGRQDETRHFIRSKLVRVERDDNHDGIVDVWEHWEKGRLVRIGYDIDRNKVADFWHRAPSSEPDESSVPSESLDDSSAEDEPDETTD